MTDPDLTVLTNAARRLQSIDHAIDAHEAWPDAMRWAPERHEPRGEGDAAPAIVEWAAQHGYPLLEWDGVARRALAQIVDTADALVLGIVRGIR